MFKVREVKIGTFFLIFSLGVTFFLVPTIEQNWEHPAKGERHFYTLGPRFFPYLSAGLMAFLATLLILGNLRESSRPREAEKIETKGKRELRHVFAFMGIGAAYIGALPLLGTALATPFCLLGLFQYFGFRSWVWELVLAGGITMLIYIIFEKMMGVHLPVGIWGL